MIKRVVVCDRCGKECAEEYYTIDIVKYGTNVINNTNSQRHYCECCKNDITTFCLTKKDEGKCANCRWAIDCINGNLNDCMYGK